MRVSARGLFAVTTFAAVIVLAGPVAAQQVFCAAGENLGTVTLDSTLPVPPGPLTLVIQGTCVVNLVITRDDVTLTTDGVAPVVISAANPALSAIQIDGARRVVIDGRFPNGFAVTGGIFGVVVNRGGSLDIANCQVTGASNTGLIASNSGTLWIDSCTVTGNTTGVTAANAGTAYVTNSNVSANTGSGVVATRSAYLRVGQDRAGNVVLKPVTVSGNGGNGIAVTHNGSANIVGGSVEGNGAATDFSNIFVGRGSSAEIGFGTGGLTGGVSIRGGASHGVHVEGGNATIVSSAITGNGDRGILVNNAGSARIGVTNTTVLAPNLISGNTTDGIGIFTGGAAFIGGNTIEGNGSFGVNVGGGSADLIGGNTITNNVQTGVFAGRSANVLIGDPGFGTFGASGSLNTISGNATGGPNTGGVFAFEGASIQVTNATISGNNGAAVQAFHSGAIDLRGTTTVTVPTTGTNSGATIQYGSTLTLRDTVSITSATSHGIQASNLSAVRFQSNATVRGGGPNSLGVNCFNSAPLTTSAATLTGNLTNVTGTAGSTSGCNVFP